MENKIWCKTLLYAYNCFEKIINDIDKTVLSSAINSSAFVGEEGVHKVFNQIQKYTTRKLLLINLKILIDEVLDLTSKDNAYLLRLKYFQNMSAEDISKAMNLSKRTYFRRYQSALDEFSFKMKSKGFSKQKLDDWCSKENWLNEIYNKLYMKEVTKNIKKVIDKQDEYDLLKSLNIYGSSSHNFIRY